MAEKYLDRTYGLQSPEETRAHYDRWAASYEAEVAENGYATPARVAEALWSQVGDAERAVLDFGCGTGLSGLALRRAGFALIDGIDPSPEMLAGAREKQAYRSLTVIELDDPAPIAPESYDLIAAIGVLGTGAAPPETLDMILAALPRGGLLGFSYNDHTLADPAYTGRLKDAIGAGRVRLLFREHGPHLPGMALESDVYVIEKA